MRPRPALYAGVYCAVVGVVVALSSRIDEITARVVTLRAEYCVVEQLSKFLLLLAMATAALAYRAATDAARIRLSIGYLLLGFTMYLSESNFIEESWQPLVGGPLILLVLAALWRTYPRLVPVVLASIVMLALAALGDLAERTELVQLVPSYVAPLQRWCARYEEELETLGTAGLVLPVFLVFADSWRRRLDRQRRGDFLLLASIGLIAVGNSFLHFQYHPRLRQILVALVISALGCTGLVLADRLAQPRDRLWLFSERGFYYHLALVFVALPIVYAPTPLSALIWVALLSWLGLSLWWDTESRRSGTSRAA